MKKLYSILDSRFFSKLKDYKENLKWYKSDISRNQNEEVIRELETRIPEKDVDSWNSHHKISEAGRKHQIKQVEKEIRHGINRAKLENEHPKLAALKSTFYSKVTNNPINRFKRAYQEQKDYLQNEETRKEIREEISRRKRDTPEEIKKRYLNTHPINPNLESVEAKKSIKSMKNARDKIIKQGESNLNHPKKEALKYAAKNWRSYSDTKRPNIPPHIDGSDEKGRYIQLLDPKTHKPEGPKTYFN